MIFTRAIKSFDVLIINLKNIIAQKHKLSFKILFLLNFLFIIYSIIESLVNVNN